MKKIGVLIVATVLVCGIALVFGVAYGVTERKESSFTIDPNSELIVSLNELYDPNFYSSTESYCLSFNFPDSNSIEEVCRIIRKEFEIFNPTADIIVTIGDEEYTTSFEDFFEWITKQEEN